MILNVFLSQTLDILLWSIGSNKYILVTNFFVSWKRILRYWNSWQKLPGLLQIYWQFCVWEVRKCTWSHAAQVSFMVICWILLLLLQRDVIFVCEVMLEFWKNSFGENFMLLGTQDYWVFWTLPIVQYLKKYNTTFWKLDVSIFRWWGGGAVGTNCVRPVW
jgi:hypothetical protein